MSKRLLPTTFNCIGCNHTFPRKRVTQRFHSYDCFNKYRRDSYIKVSYAARSCLGCGISFMPHRVDQRWHNAACRRDDYKLNYRQIITRVRREDAKGNFGK